MDLTDLTPYLARTLKNFEQKAIERALSRSVVLKSGKVRDLIFFPDDDTRMIILTTDRISAFDKVLSTIPFKGEVLNKSSLFWFENTGDIVPNHILASLSPRAVLARKTMVLPIEVVVRGYLTGSAWRDYQVSKSVSGMRLEAGMKLNQKFPNPLFTPSTKGEDGAHDLPISRQEIVERQLLTREILEKVEQTALRLFERGSKVLAKQGLILVDTKYEFGLLDGELILIDEVHTPDSSRFWYADTYEELFARGEKQRKLDKEYLRQYLMEEAGFKGDGPLPCIPDEVRIEVARRYITAYQEITGLEFTSTAAEADEELALIACALRQL